MLALHNAHPFREAPIVVASAQNNMNQVMATTLVFSALFHGLAFLLLAPMFSSVVKNDNSSNQLVAVTAAKQVAAGSTLQMIDLTSKSAGAIEEVAKSSSANQAASAPRVTRTQALAVSSDPAFTQPETLDSPAQNTSGLLPPTLVKVPDYFFLGNEVDYRAEMLLPMDMSWFDDEFALSGSLKMSIYVREDGSVDRIELLNTVDVSGALREKLLPLLQMATYSPAVKNGKPVNSIKTMEFDLVARADPKTYTSKTLAGFRPKLDAKGNIAPNQDLSLMP